MNLSDIVVKFVSIVNVFISIKVVKIYYNL